MKPAASALLTPSLQQVRAVRDLDRPAPWSVQPQILVAFFGGILAATAVAWINTGRLGLGPPERAPVLAIGAVGFLVSVGASLALMQVPLPASLPAVMTAAWMVRRVRQVVALLTWWPLARLQKSPLRRWQARVDDAAHSSLWLGGLAAVVAGGLAEAVLFVATLRLLGVQLETLAL